MPNEENGGGYLAVIAHFFTKNPVGILLMVATAFIGLPWAGWIGSTRDPIEIYQIEDSEGELKIEKLEVIGRETIDSEQIIRR